jgi:acyl carrier protein
MEDELRQIIAKIAETNADYSADADIREELGVDSHRAVELVFEIERVFDVKIPVKRFDELQTLRKATALVASLKGAAAK